jgi:hypothetical protein
VHVRWNPLEFRQHAATRSDSRPSWHPSLEAEAPTSGSVLCSVLPPPVGIRSAPSLASASIACARTRRRPFGIGAASYLRAGPERSSIAVHHRRKPARQCRDADHARAERCRRCGVSRDSEGAPPPAGGRPADGGAGARRPESAHDREQRSASSRVTKFSGEPLEGDVSTMHPVGGTS